MNPDLDALASARAIELAGPYVRLMNDKPPPEQVLARWAGATPAGRVMLAQLLDPPAGRHALAALALDDRPVDRVVAGVAVATTVAEYVRPMLAGDESLAAPPAPRPAGTETVLARRFEAALAKLCARAGTTPEEAAAGAGVVLGALPGPGATARLEAVLRERAVFAPGLLDLATRRAVEVTPDGGPAPGDLDVLCPEVQRVLDAATRADVAAGPPPRGWWGRRGVALAAAVRLDPLPGGVTYEPRVPHTAFAEYRCGEHGDYALCPVG